MGVEEKIEGDKLQTSSVKLVTTRKGQEREFQINLHVLNLQDSISCEGREIGRKSPFNNTATMRKLGQKRG